MVLRPQQELHVLDLHSLLARTSVYEGWQVPIDPTLRRVSILGSLGSILSAGAVAQAEALARFAGQLPLFVLREVLLIGLGVIAHSDAVLLVIAGALIIQLTGFILTVGWRRGRLIWHWLVCAGTLAAAVPTAAFCVLIAIVLLNAVIVILATVAMLMLGGRLLRGRSA